MQRQHPGSTHENTDEPLSFDKLLQSTYEPPVITKPEAMQSFMGWNGIVVDHSIGHDRNTTVLDREKQKLGFTRLDTGKNISAWLMTAERPYQLALPVLSQKSLTRSADINNEEDLKNDQHPLHHDWNARHYNPLPAARARKIIRDKKGGYIVPTDSLDALFFGSDDRQPYYPGTYP